MATHTHTRIGARDGITHAPSSDPAVHRALVVVDPPMRGPRRRQPPARDPRAAEGRGLTDDVPVPVHGKFTAATALACIEAQYFLGLRSDTYLRKDAHGHRVVTEGAQRVIREPETRDRDQLQRAKERQRAARPRPALLRASSRASSGSRRRRRRPPRWSSPRRRSASRSARRARTRARRSTTGAARPATRPGAVVRVLRERLHHGRRPARRARAGSATRRRSSPARKPGTGGWSFHSDGQPGRPGALRHARRRPGRPRRDRPQAPVATTLLDVSAATRAAGDGSQSDGGMVARHDDRSTMGALPHHRVRAAALEEVT